MNPTTNIQDTANVVVQGGVTATALVFFHGTMTNMIPYLIVAVPLILLDLNWGIKAARHRGDRVRLSKGIRATFGKMVEYICWCVLGASMALAFGMKWIEYGVIGIVFVNEIASIFGNYFETKGIAFSVVELWKALFKGGAQKIGVELEAEGIIKDKSKEEKKDETDN